MNKNLKFELMKFIDLLQYEIVEYNRNKQIQL